MGITQVPDERPRVFRVGDATKDAELGVFSPAC